MRTVSAVLVCCDFQRVTLTFDVLDLEQHPRCEFDSVSIYNGRDESAPLIGKYCTAATSKIQAGQHALIKFTTDGSYHVGRFRIKYKIEPRNPGQHGLTTGEVVC